MLCVICGDSINETGSCAYTQYGWIYILRHNIGGTTNLCRVSIVANGRPGYDMGLGFHTWEAGVCPRCQQNVLHPGIMPHKVICDIPYYLRSDLPIKWYESHADIDLDNMSGNTERICGKFVSWTDCSTWREQYKELTGIDIP